MITPRAYEMKWKYSLALKRRQKMNEEEKNLLPLDLDTCEQCHRLVYETSAIDEENDLMWLCVGEIIKPDKPKNLHEEINEIRVCIIRDKDSDEIIGFEWTPYEAARVAMALTWAISNYLHQYQPTLEDIENLKYSMPKVKKVENPNFRYLRSNQKETPPP